MYYFVIGQQAIQDQERRLVVTPGTRPHQAILALADQDRTHGPLQEQRQARPLVRTRLRGSNPEV